MRDRPESEAEAWPPGEYVDDDQQELTKRFVEDARTLAARRGREPDPVDAVDEEHS